MDKYLTELRSDFTDDIQSIRDFLINIRVKLMPKMRSYMFKLFLEKLKEERNRVFAHYYPLLYRRFLNELSLNAIIDQKNNILTSQ